MVRAVAAPSATVALRARLKRLGALSERQRTWSVLGGSVLLALLLRAPWLTAPLGRDEGGLSFIARHWHGGAGSLYGDYWVDRPPLLLALFKIAVLGGDHGVRLLGALAAVSLVLAIAMLARAIAGPRAGRIAAVLAALLSGSASLAAVYTPGELLAAVPSTLSVLCLVLAHRSRRARFVVAAGALAVVAALIKQSFLDAGAAGAAFVLASAVVNRDLRIRWPIAYAAGAAVPLCAVLVWLAVVHLSVGDLIYTLFGFRIHLLHTLAGSNIPLHVRLEHLRIPAWESGLLLVVAGAVMGLLQLRGDRVLLVTFSAWLAAAVVGVLGGGSYFMHYLIELVPVACVAASAAIANVPLAVRVAALAAVAALALPTANDAAVYTGHHTPHRRELAVGHYIRDHARRGETQYVMYARANVVYYAGLPQPYPYLWSLMVRVRPGAVAQLERLLRSPGRPTWLVQWQAGNLWNLDPDGVLNRLVVRGYRLAAVVCTYPVYVRKDRPRPPAVTMPKCP